MDREGLPLSSESGEGKAALNSVMRLWFIADDEQFRSNNRREGVPQNALRAGIRQYVFLRYLDKVLPCGLGCG